MATIQPAASLAAARRRLDGFVHRHLPELLIGSTALTWVGLAGVAADAGFDEPVVSALQVALAVSLVGAIVALLIGRRTAAAARRDDRLPIPAEPARPDEALRAASRFRAALASLEVFAISLDRAGRISFANEALARCVGRPIDELVGADGFELLSLPEQRDALRAAFLAGAATDWTTGEIDGTILTAAGARIETTWSIAPIRDAAGAVEELACLGWDVTKERAAEAAQARLGAAVEQTDDSVVIAAPDGAILYVNPAFERATGYSAAEVLGRNPRILKSGVQSDAFYRALWATLTSGTTWRGELVNRRKDGSLFTEDATITPVLGEDRHLTAYVAVKRDITATKAVDAALARAMEERRIVGAALDDLHAGPTAEATAARIAERLLRLPGVVVATVAGFAAADDVRILAVAGPAGPITPEDPRPVRAAYLERIGRLHQRAEAGPWIEACQPFAGHPLATAWLGLGVRSLASIPVRWEEAVVGFIQVGSDAADAEGVLAAWLPSLRDFGAMTAALLGRDLEAIGRLAERRAVIRRVIDRAEFSPVFQPIVELDSGRAVGFEALTRFADGMAPDVVFADAARTGLGLELEAATLRAALAAAHGLPPDRWLSLNVSPALVLDDGVLHDLLAAWPRPVVLEITEHEAIDDYAGLRAVIGALGPDVRLAVDDSGAGVANFHHIVELRPDFVKLDAGLIRAIESDPTRQALVVGLRHFALTSGCTVIAEGIETPAEQACLLDLGLTLGQGYLFGRPEPIEAMPPAATRTPVDLVA